MSELRKDKEKDFFERTLYNLQLYKENHSNDSKKYKYETTMLLNSLLGLLIIQKERTNLLASVDISFLNYKNSASDFFRHMRNSISHGHFIDKIQVNPETREIEQITFEDKCPNCKKITFSQTVTIDQLNMLIEQIEECFKTG